MPSTDDLFKCCSEKHWTLIRVLYHKMVSLTLFQLADITEPKGVGTLQQRCMSDGQTGPETLPYTFSTLEMGAWCAWQFLQLSQSNNPTITLTLHWDWTGVQRWESRWGLNFILNLSYFPLSHNFFCHYSWLQHYEQPGETVWKRVTLTPYVNNYHVSSSSVTAGLSPRLHVWLFRTTMNPFSFRHGKTTCWPSLFQAYHPPYNRCSWTIIIIIIGFMMLVINLLDWRCLFQTCYTK